MTTHLKPTGLRAFQLRTVDSFSADYLRARLRYEPSTGQLFWRARKDNGIRVASWNAKWVGKPALNCPDERGYLRGKVDGKVLKAHQVIMKMETGQTPDQVDHINGNPSDNRLINLRDVDQQANQRNQRRNALSKSGLPVGVTANGKRFAARIRTGGRQQYLGTFDTPKLAHDAYARAAKKAGYSTSHGAIRQLSKQEGGAHE